MKEFLDYRRKLGRITAIPAFEKGGKNFEGFENEPMAKLLGLVYEKWTLDSVECPSDDNALRICSEATPLLIKLAGPALCEGLQLPRAVDMGLYLSKTSRHLGSLTRALGNVGAETLGQEIEELREEYDQEKTPEAIVASLCVTLDTVMVSHLQQNQQPKFWRDLVVYASGRFRNHPSFTKILRHVARDYNIDRLVDEPEWEEWEEEFLES